jgi:acetamidase/formamidase
MSWGGLKYPRDRVATVVSHCTEQITGYCPSRLTIRIHDPSGYSTETWPQKIRDVIPDDVFRVA